MRAKISASMTVFENIKELPANIAPVFTQGKTPDKTTMMGIFLLITCFKGLFI